MALWTIRGGRKKLASMQQRGNESKGGGKTIEWRQTEEEGISGPKQQSFENVTEGHGGQLMHNAHESRK